MMSGSPSPIPDPAVTTHGVSIDIGSQACTMSCLTMDKRRVLKPTRLPIRSRVWLLFERLEGLRSASRQILEGMEATSRYRENLLQVLPKRGNQA
ncbi:MAG: hypothetical protein ACJ8BW_07780 [Ktedonobacteraceae bacterium]